jgi:hypothetical protein
MASNVLGASAAEVAAKSLATELDGDLVQVTTKGADGPGQSLAKDDAAANLHMDDYVGILGLSFAQQRQRWGTRHS